MASNNNPTNPAENPTGLRPALVPDCISCESVSQSPFSDREAFAAWIEKDLEKLIQAYEDFSTVNSFRDSVGR